jgi:hypothetical protein
MTHSPQQDTFEATMRISWFSSNLCHELFNVPVIIRYSEPLIFLRMTDDVLTTATAGTNTQLYISDEP